MYVESYFGIVFGCCIGRFIYNCVVRKDYSTLNMFLGGLGLGWLLYLSYRVIVDLGIR